MRKHRRVSRLRPELPLAAWERLRLAIMAELWARPARARRPSMTSGRRPRCARSALMLLATWSATGSAARADVAWATKAKNAVTATRAIAGRRSGGCVGNTGGPSLSAPTGLAGGLARKRCAQPWTDKAFRPYDLGPPLLVPYEDSAFVRGRVPDRADCPSRHCPRVGEVPHQHPIRSVRAARIL